MRSRETRLTVRAGRERRPSRSPRSCAGPALKSARTPSGGCCTRWTSPSRPIGRTSNRASSANAAIGPGAIDSSCSSPPNVEGSRPQTCPSSAWTARNASSSATSRMAAGHGGAKPVRSKTTISPPTLKAWRSPTASTMSAATPAPSWSAPRARLPSSRSMPSSTGGAARARSTIPARSRLPLTPDRAAIAFQPGRDPGALAPSPAGTGMPECLSDICERARFAVEHRPPESMSK